jgi:hypothetical protein
LIVEIDENEHKSYEDTCECARINEIVGSIRRSVIFIRFNPDKTYHKDIKINFDYKKKYDMLVQTIKNELTTEYDTFLVKVIQLYYSDTYDIYQETKEEIITDKVTC